MGMIVKTIVAFCVGLGALTAVQHFWVASITAQIAAAPQMPTLTQSEPITGFAVDGDKLSQAINPPIGQIDTATGQRLAVESAARQADIQRRNALSAVPVPRSYPGMPRY